MTTPNGDINTGVSYVWGEGHGYGQDIDQAAAWAAMRGDTLTGYTDAQDSWKGLVSDLADIADQVRDSQLDLTDRMDLLEGVQGYCNTYMSANWLVAQNQLLELPFDTQLGPSVNAEPSDGGILLHTKGLWRADALVTADKMTSSNYRAQIYITVFDTLGDAVYSDTRFDIVLTPSGSETAAFSKTFVIPHDDRYLVKVRIEHNRTARLRVFGGTLRSAFSVNKWSSNTDHNVDIPDAPDGGELG